MAPEQTNQYIEQAKLADMSEVEKQLRLDPSKFDEKALRKEFKDRLDKVIGKKQLDDRQFKMYQEALRKIDENIAGLREIKDYVVTKTRMVEMERYVKEGGLPKTVDAGIRYAMYLSDYSSLANFVLARPPKFIKTDEYVADIARANTTLLGIGELMKAYMREQFKNVGKREERRVSYSMDVGKVNLIDYMALSDAVEDLTELMHDKQSRLDKMVDTAPVRPGAPKMLRWGEADPALDALVDQAQERLIRMGETLIASRRFLNQEDRLAVENFDKAMMQRNSPQAQVAQLEAINYRAMMYNKRLAERTMHWANSLTHDQQMLGEGNSLFQQAEKESKRNPASANDLYMRARKAFEGIEQAVLAQRKEKESGSKAV
jgi:hypothetical protein